MVGFLAGVIKSTPTMEAKILAAVGPPAMKTTILMALDRAGRDEAARSFARIRASASGVGRARKRAAAAARRGQAEVRRRRQRPVDRRVHGDRRSGLHQGDPRQFFRRGGRPNPRRRSRRADASELRRERSARRLPAVGARRLRQVSVQARIFAVLARHDALLRLLGARLARRQRRNDPQDEPGLSRRRSAGQGDRAERARTRSRLMSSVSPSGPQPRTTRIPPTKRSRTMRSSRATKTSARPGISCTRSSEANRSGLRDQAGCERPAPRIGAPARYDGADLRGEPE